MMISADALARAAECAAEFLERGEWAATEAEREAGRRLALRHRIEAASLRGEECLSPARHIDSESESACGGYAP